MIKWLCHFIEIAGPHNPHRRWVIDPFDPALASPFKPRRWRLWWAYKGAWLGLWATGIFIPLLVLWLTWMFQIRQMPVFGEVLFVTFTNPWFLLITVLAPPLVLFGTRCWYNPEKSLKYLEMLGNWPIAVTRGIGDPELKHPAVKPIPVFTGVVTIDTEDTCTKVYSEKRVEVRYNWALAVIVDELEKLLHNNSKFAQDFPELQLYKGEIETTDTGTPRLHPENALRERIQKTMFFRRAKAVVHGILQAETDGLPWEDMQSVASRKDVADKVNLKIKEELQFTDDSGNIVDPGVTITFLPQDIEPPDYISDTIARQVVAQAEGERVNIVLGLLVDALKKHCPNMTDDQIAKIVMANFLSKGEGGAILGLDIFGSRQSQSSGSSGSGGSSRRSRK